MKRYLKKIIDKKQSGYILILTLFMIAMSITLLTSIVQRVLNFQKQVYFNLNRQKSRLLALGAVELALSQISFEKPKESTLNSEKQEDKSLDKQNSSKESENFEKEWFKNLVKIINKWQTIEVNEGNLNATIKLYITCQQGKLNLNYIQQQIEQQLKKDQRTQDQNKELVKKDQENIKKPEKDQENQKVESNDKKETEVVKESSQEKKGFIQSINALTQKKLKIDLIESVKELKKDILRDIESPLDFLKLKQFDEFRKKIFNDLDNQEDFYLMDLFAANLTLNEEKNVPFSFLFFNKINPDNEINPWLLSKSLCKLLELQTEGVNLQELVGKFKNNINWQKDWDDIFAPLYGKSFNSIDKEISNLFSKSFLPNAFSVVVYIKLGENSQRLFAILKKDNLNKDKNSNYIKFKIAKIYWF